MKPYKLCLDLHAEKEFLDRLSRRLACICAERNKLGARAPLQNRITYSFGHEEDNEPKHLESQSTSIFEGGSGLGGG